MVLFSRHIFSTTPSIAVTIGPEKTPLERHPKMFTHQSVHSNVYTLDLNFQGIPGTIAAYLIPHAHGAVLVECGPGSTQTTLQASLQTHGLNVSEITDVLLTHIHLDHAGAAGWLAQQGARIHVHPVGAPHLINPEKLLISAGRIYGDQMQTLWGDFLAVPEDHLTTHQDNEEIEIEGLHFTALETPGHAFHHFAYIFQGICFTGDIGGVRVGGAPHLRLPMPPPELNFELWRESARKLGSAFAQGQFDCVAPTHFGVLSDAGWHLSAIQQALDESEAWMNQVMPANPPIEALREQFIEWSRQRSLATGLDASLLDPLEATNPSGMSADGIYRYWHKVRNAS
jgi:glyoxylase-like metal-dependent hydrolase (beta-lactamase superfamily II)